MRTQANNHHQLAYLFAGQFIIVFVGMGVFPVLPLYASEFGANRAMMGLYLAFTYMAITLGTLLPVRLGKAMPRKTLHVAAGLVGAPALMLLGQANALWQVFLLTAVVWFAGGIGLALISVFTGLAAKSGNRGKSFSVLSLTVPLGGVLGGMAVGQLIAWQSYSVMFAAIGAFWLLWPLNGWFGIQDPGDALVMTHSAIRKRQQNGDKLGHVFFVLLSTSLLAAIAGNVARLGISLSMHDLDFSPRAVASTATVGGLVTIPVAFYVGALSDRFGRKQILALSYLVAASSALTLIVANQLAHFWLAATLVLVARNVSGSVSSAFVADVLAPEVLNRALPWLNTMNWIAGTLAFAGTGIGIDLLGATVMYGAVTVLALVAAVQIMRLRESNMRQTVVHQPGAATPRGRAHWWPFKRTA